LSFYEHLALDRKNFGAAVLGAAPDRSQQRAATQYSKDEQVSHAG
jgi:hypothetical protein